MIYQNIRLRSALTDCHAMNDSGIIDTHNTNPVSDHIQAALLIPTKGTSTLVKRLEFNILINSLVKCYRREVM